MPENNHNLQKIADRFHRQYYKLGRSGGTWNDTYWMNIPLQKCPLDLWIYQEIFFEQRPEAIVETGTQDGGSALYFASLCDLLDMGRVITVDITERGQSGKERPRHPRIEYVLGSSTDPEVVTRVERSLGNAANVLVVLDSDHSEAHVSQELALYSKLVPEGGYLIVEDTNLNGNPVRPTMGPGPMEAVDKFLETCDDFVADRSREKFLMTFNPHGYLRRGKRRS